MDEKDLEIHLLRQALWDVCGILGLELETPMPEDYSTDGLIGLTLDAARKAS